jgi:hypothetical protein
MQNRGVTQQSFGNTQMFGHNRHNFPAHFEQQNSIPTIMYLLTSMDPEYDPYWAHDPVALPKNVNPKPLKHGWTYQLGWCVLADGAGFLTDVCVCCRCTGFIDWIQLHPEDFRDAE